MDVLRTFSPDAFAFGLASWSWLGVHGKTPRFTNAFGDVFLESLEGWWFLDTVEGSLELRWSTAVDLYTELDSPDGRANLLLEDILEEAMQRIVLRDDEVLTFAPHPAVGGRLNAESVEPVRFELALRLAGQMHQQLRVPTPPPLLLGHAHEQHAAPAPHAQPAPWDDLWSR